MKKSVVNQKDWDFVVKELEKEKIKLMSYDNTIMNNIGNIKGNKILDYGAGPGILASVLQKLGADIKVYEVNDKILEAAAKRVGNENVFDTIKQFPEYHFDYIICNLVLCIVKERDVKQIIRNVEKLLAPEGIAFFGFCNPLIFEIIESHLDIRFPTGETYERNHIYRKIKKEGNYELHEHHRPVAWYETEFTKHGLRVIDILFTPEYDYKQNHIKDFIIFKCKRKKSN